MVSAWLAVAQLVLTSAPAAAQGYRAIAAAVTQNAIGPLTGSLSGTGLQWNPLREIPTSSHC